MGIADRDYYREYRQQGGHLGGISAWSITTWLIILNVAVFVIDGMLTRRPYPYGPLYLLGYFSAARAIFAWEAWRFITFQFLHANLQHLFFNMLALYFFGPMIEMYLGRRRYLGFYLLCGMAGGAFYLVLWVGHMVAAQTPLVGASAGIFGVLIAAARVAPDAMVDLLFPPITLRLRTVAIIMLGIAVFTILTNGENVGGQAAHIGGAALGAVLIAHPRWLNIFNLGIRPSHWRRPSPWEHDSW